MRNSIVASLFMAATLSANTAAAFDGKPFNEPRPSHPITALGAAMAQYEATFQHAHAVQCWRQINLRYCAREDADQLIRQCEKDYPRWSQIGDWTECGP